MRTITPTMMVDVLICQRRMSSFPDRPGGQRRTAEAPTAAPYGFAAGNFPFSPGATQFAARATVNFCLCVLSPTLTTTVYSPGGTNSV